MKNGYILNITDVCVSTYTNSDGMSLKLAVSNLLNTHETVILSFHGIDSVSTSFMNSFFGELVSEYGLDIFKNRIRVTNYTNSLLNVIKSYIKSLSYQVA